MININILEKLGNKEIDTDDAVQEIKNNYDLLPAIIEGISSLNARIKFGCAKILRTISEENPEKLYSNVDFFITLLNHDNNIIKWNAMDILANLTRVDTKNKFNDVFSKYYSLLSDDAMVTVAHVVDNSGKIALAKPKLTEKITDELLKVEKLSLKPRLTQECKNIIIGKTILAFSTYYNQIDDKEKIISFVTRQLNNTRKATKIKADKFLKKNQ